MYLYLTEHYKEMTVLGRLIFNSSGLITSLILKILKTQMILFKKTDNSWQKESTITKVNLWENNKNVKLSAHYKTCQQCLSKCQIIQWLTGSTITRFVEDNNQLLLKMNQPQIIKALGKSLDLLIWTHQVWDKEPNHHHFHIKIVKECKNI